jgi:hypothetical protein
MVLLSAELMTIAKSYDLVVHKHDLYGGATAGGYTIWLNPMNPTWMKEIAFWHELGHCLLARLTQAAGRTHSLSHLSAEGAAWELGLNEAATHGWTWDYNSRQLAWARRCLVSYAPSDKGDLT